MKPPATDRFSDRQLLWIGYSVILLLLGVRLWYLGSGIIELSEDEAYQWLWSKHLDLSYFSKPPLIAYAQFLGTSLWGDTEFGVRFVSPVLGALLSWMMLRFLAAEINLRSGVAFILVATATPLLAVGSTLLTIDPLSVFFWTASMISGWHALRNDKLSSWIWTGIWMGLGFLSKYIGLFQWVCFAVFFLLWPPARQHLKKPGPYAALAINLLLTIPVLIWNSKHEWITVTHLADRGGLDETWNPSAKYVIDFLGAEFFLLNPVFFVGSIWAAVAFWKRPREPIALYFFSMSAPLFLFYLFYTLRAQVQPNWIAPSAVPLFCLALWYWNPRLHPGTRAWRFGLAGLFGGLIAVVVLHNTDIIATITGRPLPAKIDPLRRVRGWESLAGVANQSRTNLMAEGKPVFLIGDHYGITGLLSFYIPEARSRAAHDPIVFFETSDRAINQFYFWPSYAARHGQNAIYVQRANRPKTAPPNLLKQFASVTSIGFREIAHNGRVLHRIQLYECRNLLPSN